MNVLKNLFEQKSLIANYKIIFFLWLMNFYRKNSLFLLLLLHYLIYLNKKWNLIIFSRGIGKKEYQQKFEISIC